MNSSLGLVVILGLLAMLMPLSIDMYLPALPEIAREFGVTAGSVQMTLNIYILGFALGQLVYGPLADSFGRKPLISLGTLIFSVAAAACAMAQTIDQLIVMRLLHGLSAAAGSVVSSALMRDCYSKEEFSRMMSFMMMVTTIAPLLAPIIGGWLLQIWSWHAIFWTLSMVAVVTTIMVATQIRETLPADKRQKFNLWTTLINFLYLVRHRQAFSYMLASGLSFAGMFSFLNAGPFVYIELNHISPQDFGYYFALNVVFLFLMTLVNSRSVRRFGPVIMFRFGLSVQFAMALWLVVVSALNLGFLPLVFGVAMYIGCVAMVSSNAMAVILEEFPHMAGTASSLAGALRFGVGALTGALLSTFTFTDAWPMVGSIFICASLSVLLFMAAIGSRKDAV
ncbi:Bcr/CflA family multidrug efflux MFS transporter [Erwinia tracheiphila]|uniref:Bcr/CflA family efflux transporter n=2 Tax=Erwinia tracheiphila TaxID=65700 RepID=A0A0M2K4P0_9GAMM|nr:Bcr/CflA family drug resistance efflux transporter [Erwinia tracheiphila]KKF34360.1 bicyclomycin/multidrug efflux system [Erwinia tracheiphila]UIA85754.1 Bcr/CflA family multidrug efflux MFS transporter [Erwinia tracheiphila]UIA90040.1 Bcr/CflA family multidrug efflux MFS transporter [Erwinia tracheiphila]UIA94280.1 Bcr/CflA family multidrug efflux MFS transporter [Erwinia tracheiphila]